MDRHADVGCSYSAVTVRVRCFTSPSSTENLTLRIKPMLCGLGGDKYKVASLREDVMAAPGLKGLPFFLLYIWVPELVLEDHCLSE